MENFNPINFLQTQIKGIDEAIAKIDAGADTTHYASTREQLLDRKMKMELTIDHIEKQQTKIDEFFTEGV